MTEREAPESESTISHPDHVETRDLRGERGRNAETVSTDRAEAPQPSKPIDEQAVQIGRYQLLGMVGAGGMGMVWGAWDPELERRVALKLMRYSSPTARERMLHEGQLLARLSHPNVVPVFDVGVMDEQVYLVMEWIRGRTLRAHAAEAPSAAAVLAAYREAGEGIAAAHRAGVIHRDFKPDNVIVGDDDRVRVLDFGIAQDDTRTASTGSGTPRYMPPEQQRGDAVTAAADQYAFCVSLREAFDKHGGTPSWIVPILERGCDPDPARRYPAMDDLLAALAHDPKRARRRAAVGVALVGLAIGAFAIGRSRVGSSDDPIVEPCSGAAAELDPSWNPAIRARVVANLTSLGPLADPTRVAGDLDRHATEWIAAHRSTCLANERKQLTPALYEGRLRCLARARSQLAAAGELLGGVKVPGLANALVAASSLPDAASCADDLGIDPPRPEILDRVRAISARVERALVLARARSPEAVPASASAAADARATEYAPLVARAVLVEGRALQASQKPVGDKFKEAMLTALSAHDDVAAVEAYARLYYFYPETIDQWPVMSTIAERLDRAGRFARALLYNNRGLHFMLDGEYDEARKMYDLAAKAAGDADDVELVSIMQNRAQLSAPDTASELFRAAHERLAGTLGRDHRDTIQARTQLAFTIRDPVAARIEVERACLDLERWPNAVVEPCAYEAAWLADEAGDRAGARSWFQRVAGKGFVGPIAEAYLGVTAEPPNRDALKKLEPFFAAKATSQLYERQFAGDAFAVAAHLDPRYWERALAMAETLRQSIFEHRLAHARAMTAAQLKTSRPDEARRLAELARGYYGK